METEHITFSFGENWKNFLNTVGEKEIQQAAEDIKLWISQDEIKDKRIIDIGSGSGIHSYIFYSMKAGELLSMDYDNNSVAATKRIWQKANSPSNWHVMH